MTTEWRLVDGFDGVYRVSSDGRVQSCSVKGTCGKRGEWWDMTIGRDRIGYPLVYLWDKCAPTGKQRVRRLVHRLVATAFIPNVAQAEAINHKNGIKDDNRVENLEWCSRSGNMKHAWATGLCKPKKLTASKVRRILAHPDNDTNTAKAFGISQVMVTRIRAGKAWTHITGHLRASA